MADRFHFNPESGRTGKCSAQVQCRFGQSEDQHGASREEARANYESQMEPQLFANTTSKATGRFSKEQLDSEEAGFEEEYRYSIGEIMDVRDIGWDEIEEAEAQDGGWITVKIPSYSEASFSTELARRTLEKREEERRSRPRGIYGW